MIRSCSFLTLLCTVSLAAQSPAPTFVAADVQASPHRTYPFYYSLLMPDDRLIVRDATLVDLISTAWGLDAENVQGGPGWLELERFDIIAKVPHGASKSDENLMLRDLLTQRFHVALKNTTQPMPAYVLSVPDKAKLKMRQSEGSGDLHCEPTPGASNGGPNYINISCHNMTMDDMAQQLHQMAGGYLKKPVVNSTGLEGAWDFDIKWSDRGQLDQQGADGISIFDAVAKQLGLKLALDTTPRPVVTVETAQRQPTPNAADIAKILPPPPIPQFEVATIKPAKPGSQPNGGIHGGEINFTSIPLRVLINLAWDLNQNDLQNISGAPKWLDDDKFDVVAKASTESAGKPFVGGLPMDIYEVRLMLQALLIERFQIKAHMEEHPADEYTLLAVNPKLKPGDPTVRTGCKDGPGPDGKDPRIQNPVLSRLLSCRNITMAEFGDQLQRVAGGYVSGPVFDATGLTGSYDFTLNFSPSGVFNHPPAAAGSDTPSEPTGALSLTDAINKQLGLKLEKQKHPMPVLVIEHINEKPTVN